MAEPAETILRAMDAADWPSVCAIYAEGIATGIATFETQTPPWERWNAGHLEHSRLIAVRGSEIVGFAALSPVSTRDCYRGVAEVSVYIAGRTRGHGTGRQLLQALVEESEKHGIWTLQAGIFAENTASLRLHERCGFREVGRRERIGCLHEVWRDTVLMERRSDLVGRD
jgi:phosphinothricin acetyltransferase